jgi:hypothetical protein
MKDIPTEALDRSWLSEVLDCLEDEAEYMEYVQYEEEYANGMLYVIDVLREWYDRKTFVEVDFSRRNAEFRRDVE